MTIKEELKQTMNELRKMASKKRTIYGYDIIKAVDVAFKMAEDEYIGNNKTEIMRALLNTLCGDDFVFEVLHAKAKKEFEAAMKTGGYLDDFIEKLSDLVSDDDSGSDDEKDDVSIVDAIAELFGVKKEDKE